MIGTMLWRYTIWLVVIRMLLPVVLVVLRDFAGVDLTNAGIPVVSALLAAAVAGRIAARAFGRMPNWRELVAFAFLSTLIFFVINYVAYLLLALTGIGPIYMHHLVGWHVHGHIVGLMTFLTAVALVSNAVLFPTSTKIELKALARRAKTENTA